MFRRKGKSITVSFALGYDIRLTARDKTVKDYKNAESYEMFRDKFFVIRKKNGGANLVKLINIEEIEINPRIEQESNK